MAVFPFPEEGRHLGDHVVVVVGQVQTDHVDCLAPLREHELIRPETDITVSQFGFIYQDSSRNTILMG